MILGHCPFQFIHVIGLLGPGFFKHALHGVELALCLQQLFFQGVDIRQWLLSSVALAGGGASVSAACAAFAFFRSSACCTSAALPARSSTVSACCTACSASACFFT